MMDDANDSITERSEDEDLQQQQEGKARAVDDQSFALLVPSSERSYAHVSLDSKKHYTENTAADDASFAKLFEPRSSSSFHGKEETNSSKKIRPSNRPYLVPTSINNGKSRNDGLQQPKQPEAAQQDPSSSLRSSSASSTNHESTGETETRDDESFAQVIAPTSIKSSNYAKEPVVRNPSSTCDPLPSLVPPSGPKSITSDERKVRHEQVSIGTSSARYEQNYTLEKTLNVPHDKEEVDQAGDLSENQQVAFATYTQIIRQPNGETSNSKDESHRGDYFRYPAQQEKLLVAHDYEEVDHADDLTGIQQVAFAAAPATSSIRPQTKRQQTSQICSSNEDVRQSRYPAQQEKLLVAHDYEEVDHADDLTENQQVAFANTSGFQQDSSNATSERHSTSSMSVTRDRNVAQSTTDHRVRRYYDKMRKYDDINTRAEVASPAAPATASSSRWYRDKVQKYDITNRRSTNTTQSLDREVGPVILLPEDDDDIPQESRRSSSHSLPGAVSMSEMDGERQLRKGRLTTMHSLEEEEISAASQSSPTMDAEFNEMEEKEKDSENKSSSKWSWWHGKTRRFKVVAVLGLLLLVVAIAVGVAVPLSSSSSSSSMQDDNVDSDTKRIEMLEFISTVSDRTIVEEVGTPQNLAFEWIVAQDKLSSTSPSNTLQRYALVVFYYATGGPDQWITTRYWLDGTVDECRWRFVVCNAQGQVETLAPKVNMVTGEIPAEIGILSSLTSLVLYQNSISRLPDELTNLTALEVLDVDQNALEGTIPSVVYTLTSLHELHMLSNSLTGTISTTISSLSRLSHLDLGSNKLSGTIPTRVMPSLKTLLVNDNNLTGNLTDILLSFPRLENAWLARNMFLGKVPSGIGLVTTIIAMALDHNMISSSLPTEIGLLTSLEFLRISASEISGTIPSELSNCKNLTTFEAFANPLLPPFPEEICELRPPQGVLEFLQLPCTIGCTCCTNC